MLDADDPAALVLAAAALSSGRVLAVPTDTVYGLAVDPTDPVAAARLFALKGRPDRTPLPVLVAGLDQAVSLADPIPEQALRLAERFWPGPLTLVLRRRAGVVLHLGISAPPGAEHGGGAAETVGIRCPDHALLRSLCLAEGPLAVTSANRHGEPPCTSASQVVATFADRAPGELALVLDGGPCDGAVSTVVDLTGAEPRCLREGALDWATVLAVLGTARGWAPGVSGFPCAPADDR